MAEPRKLPDTRAGFTRKFKLAYVHKDGSPDLMRFYFTVGLYEDGTVGEVFIKADKTGTLASGALDACAIMISMSLQHGVPLEKIIEKLRHMRFSPAGFTKDKDYPSCTSALDLLAQWLTKFLPKPQDVP